MWRLDKRISVVSDGSYDDYISLTDIARYKSEDTSATIQNWMRSRDVIEFLGLWETLNNPEFKPLEFEGFKVKAGSNAFTLSPKRWIEATEAVGIYSKSGRGGGTYADRDIAFDRMAKDQMRLLLDSEGVKRLMKINKEK